MTAENARISAHGPDERLSARSVEKAVSGQTTGAAWLRSRPKAEKPEPTYGMCLSCRSIEVELFDVIGTRDFSSIGEHPRYPVGHGCEVCS